MDFNNKNNEEYLEKLKSADLRSRELLESLTELYDSIENVDNFIDSASVISKRTAKAIELYDRLTKDF